MNKKACRFFTYILILCFYFFAVQNAYCSEQQKGEAQNTADALIEKNDSATAAKKRLSELEDKLHGLKFDKQLLKQYVKLAFNIGEYKKADKALKKLCELDRNNADLIADRLIVLRRLKDFAEAESAGNQLYLSAPAHWRGLNNLALIFCDEGKFDEALKTIDAAYQINPADVRIQLNRAKIMSKAGDTEKAKIVVNEILTDYPQYTKAISNEGVLKYLSGEKDGGEISFDEACEISGSLYTARLNKEICRLNRGQYLPSLRKLTELEIENPENVLVKQAIATALMYLGRYEEACKKAEEGIEIAEKKDLVNFLNLTGAALFMQEKYAEAEAMFTRALLIDPDSVQANSNLALCCKKQALFVKAELFLTAAIEQEPFNPNLFYNIATVYEARGKDKEAIQAFSEYLELSPGNSDAKAVRERIEELKKSIKKRNKKQ